LNSPGSELSKSVEFLKKYSKLKKLHTFWCWGVRQKKKITKSAVLFGKFYFFFKKTRRFWKGLVKGCSNPLSFCKNIFFLQKLQHFMCQNMTKWSLLSSDVTFVILNIFAKTQRIRTALDQGCPNPSSSFSQNKSSKVTTLLVDISFFTDF
jgi:hypothetical protein